MMMKTVHRRFTSVTAATWLRPLGGILAVLVLLSSQSASAHSANGVQHLRSRRHLQQSSLNITTTSIIPLFFSISYFDGTTSGGLESLDPNDEAVLALCKAVHEQAGGNQVKLAASDVGVLVDTIKNEDECRLIQTNRVYGPPAPSSNLFRLELAVTQSVQASTSNTTLLTSLVETGFNRGQGGRARFLELLQDNQIFAFVGDVDVLIGTLSSMVPSETPSDVPTPLPTTASPITPGPTTRTTLPPTFVPSTQPSVDESSSTPSVEEVLESGAPSSLPSVAPSVTTTRIDAPSLSPSVTIISNSSLPSLSPSLSTPPPTQGVVIVGPTDGVATGEDNVNNTNGLSTWEIIAICAAALVFILICCGCLRCWCCAACCKKENEDNDNDEEAPARPLNNNNNPKSDNAIIIPDMVQLDNDNQSLANTTLGEYTAGRKPAGRKPPRKKRLVAMTDSFDESSIYTSTGVPVDPKMILPGRRVGEDAASSSSHTFSNMLGGGAQEASSTEPSSLGGGSITTRSSMELGGERINVESSSSSSSSPTTSRGSPSTLGVRKRNRHDEIDALDTEPGAWYDSDGEEGLLGAVANTSPIIADRIEDLVDAELDNESSDDSSFGSAEVAIPEMSSSSPLDLLKLRATGSNVIIVDDEFSEEISQGEDLWNGNDKHADKQQQEQQNDSTSLGSRSSVTTKIGNTSPATPSSSKSAGSFYGTPLEEEEEGPDPPGSFPRVQQDAIINNLASPSALNQTRSLRPSSRPNSRNASPVYRSRYVSSPSPPKELAQHFVPRRDSMSPSQSPDKTGSAYSSPQKSAVGSPPRSPVVLKETIEGFLATTPKTPSDAPATSLSSHTTPVTSNEAGPITPMAVRRVTSNSVFRSSPASLKTVNPNRDVNKPSESVSPESSDSEEDNSFLFGAVERTLGPRSASADMESISGRSGRSRSASSRKKRRRHKSTGASVGSGRSGRSSTRRGTRSVSSSTFGESEEKSNELSMMTPRTLEHDLHRLEKQLATLKKEVKKTKKHRSAVMPSSPLTMSTGDAASLISHASSNATPRVSQKQRLVVVVPPGKLGVVLANRRNGLGTVVAQVRESSALYGAVAPGDKIVAIDGMDVSDMVVKELTGLMAQKMHAERHMTVLTANKVKPLSSEEVKSYSP